MYLALCINFHIKYYSTVLLHGSHYLKAVNSLDNSWKLVSLELLKFTNFLVPLGIIGVMKVAINMKINCEITKAVVSALQQNDIDCYLVGGYVRDTLLNIEAVDIDIELHNTNLEQAYQIISNITPANVYGSFGVIALDAVNTEFALARTEVKTGDKHTNFDIQFITDGNLKLACLRRDFTINSMMYDLANDRLLDFYNGQSDLNHSILRHVSDKFSEDSLRVLRGVKFACRYNLKIADETEALCKSLAPDLKHLPTKRIENEMNAIFKGANDYSLKLLDRKSVV